MMRADFIVVARKAVARVFLLTGIAMAVAACQSDDVTSVPGELVESVTVSGLAGLRSWADDGANVPDEVLGEYAERFRAYNEDNGRKFNILALSGGGQSGAYGAGLLNGWSEHGSRPVFDVVTGISTGAIIAPFAFLGSKYDLILKEIYTQTTTKDIGRVQLVRGLTGGEGVLQPDGFEKLLEKHVTPSLVAEIAEESQKGRILLIGTTNIEAERGVIWNISVLAMSDYPGKVALLRKIIQASASIPGAFPPVRISVSHDSEDFEELHVDGGVTEQVFLYPANISIRTFEKALGYRMDKRVFVVRNTKIDPSFKPIDARTLQIVERSFNTLIMTQGRADVRKIAGIAKRDDMEFQLAAIPSDFSHPTKEFFDPAFMQPLFAIGFSHGRQQDAWMREAP